MSRAERRAALDKRKAEVRARLRRWWGKEPTARMVGRHAGVRRLCSCWMCSAEQGRPAPPVDSDWDDDE